MQLTINEHLYLQTASLDEAGDLYEAVVGTLDDLAVFMPWARGKYTREDASENLKRHVEKGTIETLFSIYYQDKLVGRISYERFDDGRKMAEIGYWISKDVSGQGLMTLCCERLIKHIFEDTIYETILIEADARNLASRRIPEKLGFEFLGVVEFATHEEGRGFVDKARYLLRK